MEGAFSGAALEEGDFDFPDHGPPSPALVPVPLSEVPNRTEPRLQVHTFSADFEENLLVHFQIVIFEGCVWLWFGNGQRFSNLSVSLPLPAHLGDPVSSTCVLGEDEGEDWSLRLSRRLALKTHKTWYISCNVDPPKPNLQPAVERRLLEELRTLQLM
eukprot:RCo048839